MTEVKEREKLTDWKNAPTLRELKQDLEDAEIDRASHQAKVNTWLDNLKTEGKARPVKVKGRSNVVPKVIRKQAEWRYSSLSAPFLTTPDIFNVSPITASDRLRAQQNALVLNNQFNRKIPKVAFIDAYVRDAVNEGTVFVEVGWISEEQEMVETEPVYQFIPIAPEHQQQAFEEYSQLIQMKEADRDAYEQYMTPGQEKVLELFRQTGQLYTPQETGEIQQISRIVEVKNQPTLEVCESANLIIDPSCNGDLSKVQFMGKRFKTSLSELKKDGRYKNLEHIMIEESNPLADPDFKESIDNKTFSFKDEPRKQIVAYTYWGNWDIHKTGIAVPIMATWVNNTLIRMEENPFPFKTHPFVGVAYMPIKGSVYGEPDGTLLEENQQIIGAVTRGMIDLMGKSANSQTGTKQGFLDAVNKRKFARGDDYEFNTQGDPRQAVYQHVYPEIPQSAYNMISMQNTDAESLTGVKAFTSGINSQALGNSVGGGRDAMDAASKREAGILLRLAEGIKDIGRKIIAMNAVFLSEEEVVRITNEKFITVRRDDLAGNFDLELTISTPEEDNKKAEELAFMLQTTGNNMDTGLRNMILSDIARLRKMPDMAKRIEEFKPEPDPMQQKEMELQITLLEAQIAKEQALTSKHNSEAQANMFRGAKDGSQADLNSAKTETESAKTRNLHSDSDKKDLEYIDKHSGISHQRDLEMQDRKAHNDASNTFIKASLTDNKKE